MGLFEVFKRQPAILTLADLDDFLDSRAAFTAQKCVFEFSRASAGYVWQPLFKESTFLDALERSRWACFPLALADVGEVAFGILKPHSPDEGYLLASGLQTAMRRVMARYAAPRGMTPQTWQAAGDKAAARVARASTAARRAVKDVSRSSAMDVQRAMPIHEKIKGRDPEFVRSNFTMSLLGIHEELVKRGDPVELSRLLIAGGREVP
jgi:hypothetical protein